MAKDGPDSCDVEVPACIRSKAFAPVWIGDARCSEEAIRERADTVGLGMTSKGRSGITAAVGGRPVLFRWFCWGMGRAHLHDQLNRVTDRRHHATCGSMVPPGPRIIAVSIQKGAICAVERFRCLKGSQRGRDGGPQQAMGVKRGVADRLGRPDCRIRA